MFLFISQVGTGVFLALYYVPSADHAHTTVAYIVKEVSSGSFVRSIHVYGSSAIIVVLLLHIAQTILFGSYRGQRHLLWLSGCVLFVMLAMAFTGYLLPWDQKAFFATAVSTNIFVLPVIGPWIKAFVRGGNELGTLTISRFFVAHVFVLPALIFAFVATHVYLFRQAGAAGAPVRPRRGHGVVLSTPINDGHGVCRDRGSRARRICALDARRARAGSQRRGHPLSPTTRVVLRSDFSVAQYWPGARAVVGIFVIPTIVAVLFAALPFLDRGTERRP